MFSTISVNERDFILDALKADCRVGGRSLHDWRSCEIKYGEKNGQVLLKLGKTHVLTTSHLKLMAPTPAKPQEGFLKFNIEFDCLQQMAEFANQTATLQEMRIEM